MEYFHDHIKDLMKIATCPVCFERLPPEVVCCVNGHAICRGCKKTMTECPTCRKAFSAEGHTFVSQLLEALPYACANEGCSAIFFGTSQLKDHEKLFCSHRITVCKMCSSWIGQLKELKSHAQICPLRMQGSSDTEIYLHLSILDPETSSLKLKFENGKYYATLMSTYYDQFFWRDQILDSAKDKLTLRFSCLPDEKGVKSCFTVNITFQTGSTKLVGEIDLIKNYEDGVLEGSLTFDTEMLKKLRGDRDLKYMFSIKKN